MKINNRKQNMDNPNTNLLIPEENFEKLAQQNDFYCISLYVPLEMKEDKLYGKKVLEEQIDRLVFLLNGENIKGQEALNYISPIKQLLNKTDLWETDKELGKTLVVFVNENNIYHFKISSSLQRYLHLTSNFYLLPLFKEALITNVKEDIEKTNDLPDEEAVIINRVEKIIPLAFEGKIDTLYVSASNGIYGIYDDDNKTTMIDEKKGNTNMSLLNLAALHTYLNDGKVRLINPEEMPVGTAPIHAIIKNNEINNIN